MKFEIYQDKSSQWRWHLVATNGKIVADSAEAYHNRKDCEHGISLVKGCSDSKMVEVDSK
jgi:uncharacterized protein